MTDLPQGYEPHEIPADYTGKLFIEGQMRAFAKAETMRLREVARMALDDFEYLRRELGSLVGVVVDEPLPAEKALREVLNKD